MLPVPTMGNGHMLFLIPVLARNNGDSKWHKVSDLDVASPDQWSVAVPTGLRAVSPFGHESVVPPMDTSFLHLSPPHSNIPSVPCRAVWDRPAAQGHRDTGDKL